MGWSVMEKKELIKQCKKHNLYVSENSNAIHAARTLLEANKRLCELEALTKLPCGEHRDHMFENYMLKWWK